MKIKRARWVVSMAGVIMLVGTGSQAQITFRPGQGQPAGDGGAAGGVAGSAKEEERKKDWLPLLPASKQAKRVVARDAGKEDVSATRVKKTIENGIAILLAQQEGLEKSEWPYEGVYRVGGQIPVGYRVGGTAICGMALIRADGYADDKARQEAVARAVKFIGKTQGHELMSFEQYDAGYDVRGWGYTYGLWFLAELSNRGLVEKDQQADVRKNMEWFVSALEATEIPRAGGWNYARPSGKNRSAPPSSFMTGPTVQALLAARDAGVKVNQEVLDRAVKFLESTKTISGSVVYSGSATPESDKRDGLPGAMGRMCSVELALLVSGKGSKADTKQAVEAFIRHWGELDKRRQMRGTHEGAYGVAPYYFMFAHFAASQAIEMLDEADRPELREKCDKLLMSVQAEDGSFNDRVFSRSSAYGTAMAMLSLMERDQHEHRAK